MTLEEIEILKQLVAREHKSDVIRALEELERVEKQREVDRIARGETAAEADMRERVYVRAGELVQQLTQSLIALLPGVPTKKET